MRRVSSLVPRHTGPRAEPVRCAPRSVARPAPGSVRTAAVGAGLACLALAAPAGAARPRSVPVVEQPIAATGVQHPSIGNGITAWLTTREDTATKKHHVDVWRLQSGVPTRVASVLDTGKQYGYFSNAIGLEVGTTKDRVPVALVRLSGSENTVLRDRTYLVRMDTGRVTRLPSFRRGLFVGGTAIDAGRVYFTLGRRHPNARSTSALWTAPVTGSEVGRATRLRTSSRNAVWSDVIADRGRVALNTSYVPKKPVDYADYFDAFEFGTPRGPWRRTSIMAIAAGPHGSHVMTGFTRGGALVSLMTRGDDGLPSLLTRSPKRGAETSVELGADPARSTGNGAFDPATGRLLNTQDSDPDAPDAPSPFGFSGVAFAP